MVYDLLQSDEARRLMAAKVAAMVTEGIGSGLERWIVNWFLRRELVKKATDVKRLERANTIPLPLSESGVAGVERLLTGPVALQIESVGHGKPSESTFIFGHTHKAYEQHYSWPEYPGGVNVYNTGGWVVDETRPSVVQGAAAVVLDDDLNVATVRLYNQTAPGATPEAVRSGSLSGSTNPLLTHLQSVVVPDEQPWSTMTDVAAAEITARIDLLNQLIANGVEQLKK
jgi:hypothetical protein